MFSNKIDIGKIKECIDTVSEVTSIGMFYGLCDKEYFYHERTLYYMLRDSQIQKKLVKNLFSKEDLQDFEITDIESEKVTSELRRIDLFFNIKFGSEKTWPVIIELKTGTENHDGQLTHYYEYVLKKYHREPKCFYITPDRRKPDVSNEKNDIVNDYKCLSYWDIVKGIHSENPMVTDYIKTVEESSIRDAFSNFDVFQIYKALFEKIKEKVSGTDNSSKVEWWPEGLEIESFDFEKTLSEHKGIYLKLRIEKENGSLAIERRWEKKGDSTLSSLYYGIWKEEDSDDQKYKSLIKHWKECGRELNCDITEKDEVVIKNKKAKKKINKDCWYVVQYLTGWMMPLWDNLRIINGISDVESWTQWIVDDFKLIQIKNGDNQFLNGCN